MRNLAVDNEVIVPLNKVVTVLITAAPDGVIHDWTIPSFGSKVDAVPGRITSTWFKPTVEGIFYGQCSELCGKDHAFMPIGVRVVKEEVFASWTDTMKQANAAGTAASAEKDKEKRKQLLQQKKELLEKAKGIVRQAALEQAGVRQFAKTGDRPRPSEHAPSAIRNQLRVSPATKHRVTGRTHNGKHDTHRT